MLSVDSQFEVTNTIQICDGQSYFEGTSEYTVTGIYTDLYSSVQGCDSIVTTDLTVNTVLTVLNTIELCEGESHTEGDNTYSTTGIYEDTYTSVLGCDSIVTTDLTVNVCCTDQFTTNEVSICDGESYFEQISEYTLAGTYTDLYSTVEGCDSTVTTVLTVFALQGITNQVSICEGTSYLEGTSEYSEAGTYTDIYTDVNGCDSTVTTVLAIDSEIIVTNEIELCEGESYTEGANEYSTTGIYTDNYTSVQGCDSIVITDLTIHPVYEFTNEVEICDGYSYFEGTSEYTLAGTYTDLYASAENCDSTIITILTVNPTFEFTNDVTITDGEIYTEGDSQYATSGTYTDVYLTMNGCDSTIITNLTVNATFETTNVAEICDGDTYEEGDSQYTTAGTYTDLYTSVLGTDSTVTTVLTVNPVFEFTNEIVICEGDSYSEGTSVYSVTGVFEDLYATLEGCDSLIITDLIVVDEIVITNNISLCSGETHIEGTNSYDETGVYEDTYSSVLGCDSTVITDLVILETLVSPNFIVLCSGETWNEGTSTYDITGIYEDVYTDVNGCDSIVLTDLLILDTETTTNFVEICAGSSYSEGTSVYNMTGIYEDIYQDIEGCDSTVVTNLTILPPIEITNNVEICTGSTYTEGSSVYDTAGTYSDLYTTAEGCDSTVITNLAISDFVTNTNTISICEGESYAEGSSTYTTSGTYNDTYTTATGCDSLVITELTVNELQSITNSPTICEGQVYLEGTSNYTVSGTYTDIYPSIFGCDSTVTTVLTVIEQITVENIASICEGEIYIEGDSEYQASGTYTDIYASTQGCDSIVITVLTVNALQSTTNTINICEGESHQEGTSSYSETGIYTDVYQNIFGCDSTVTTLLTVNQNVETEQFRLVCQNQPIPQFGAYYDEPNNRFIDTLQTSLGCDSLVFTYLEYLDPEVLLPPEIELCMGQSFIANIDGLDDNWTINWSTGGTTSTESFTDEGIYWVDIESEFCVASDSISIVIHSPLSLGMSDLVICSETTLQIDLTNEDGQIVWNDGTEDAILEVEEAGTYSAQVTNACGSYIYVADVEEEDCSCKIFVPNAITADGDNMNEVFIVEHYCDFVEYELLIFNRWGEVVFQTTDPYESWTGNHENGDYYVPEGVYTYLLKYSSRDVTNRVIADKLYGSVTVVR